MSDFTFVMPGMCRPTQVVVRLRLGRFDMWIKPSAERCFRILSGIKRHLWIFRGQLDKERAIRAVEFENVAHPDVDVQTPKCTQSSQRSVLELDERDSVVFHFDLRLV